MERRLKERLVGAAILVVLIVLVVPELLSGPKLAVKAVAPARTVIVDLDTNKRMPLVTPLEAPGAASAVASPDALPPATQPATSLPEIESPQTQAPPLTAVPAQSASTHSTAIENQGPVASGAAKSWAVQLGSFVSHANAEQLARSVKLHNSPAYVSTSGAGRSVRYRVRVGPLPDRAAAERMLAKLKGEGHPASVVAP